MLQTVTRPRLCFLFTIQQQPCPDSAIAHVKFRRRWQITTPPSCNPSLYDVCMQRLTESQWECRNRPRDDPSRRRPRSRILPRPQRAAYSLLSILQGVIWRQISRSYRQDDSHPRRYSDTIQNLPKLVILLQTSKETTLGRGKRQLYELQRLRQDVRRTPSDCWVHRGLWLGQSGTLRGVSISTEWDRSAAREFQNRWPMALVYALYLWRPMRCTSL